MTCDHLHDPVCCLSHRRIAFFNANGFPWADNPCENCATGILREREAAKIRPPELVYQNQDRNKRRHYAPHRKEKEGTGLDNP